ncbi:hypothetical protein GCM10009765_80610 [Fodinicola feengrottensis]|uniref:Tetratricopeptide repeat protein n=2 Tax=Fodinicola feengrottensis TaxID=435914 RepID=A0ABN2J8Q9_9ACTN
MLPTRSNPKIGIEQAQEARGLVGEIIRLDNEQGGDTLCEAAAATVDRVDQWLQFGEYSERVGRELQLALAELQEATGWVHYDAGRQQTARYWYQQALCQAQITGNLPLEVGVLGCLSMQAAHLGRAREAIQLAVRAQEQSAGWAPPRVKTYALLREALGWAEMGDLGEAHRVMARAHHTYRAARHDDDPPWVWFLDPAEMTAIDGYVLAAAGKHDAATKKLGDAIEIGGPFPRNQTFRRLRQGEAILRAGNVAEARDRIGALLPEISSVSSGRIRQRTLAICERAKLSNTSAGRELVEKAASMGVVA